MTVMLSNLGLDSKPLYAYTLFLAPTVSLSKYQGKGLYWHIWGLGLSKAERRIFKRELLHPVLPVNLYLGKVILSIAPASRHREPQWRILFEMPLRKWLKMHWWRLWERLWLSGVSLINAILHRFRFRKRELFTVNRSYEPPVKIRTDVLTAYQLASNYEADLWRNRELIYSPLGYEWEENKSLVQKYLGWYFRPGYFYGYAHFDDVEILEKRL